VALAEAFVDVPEIVHEQIDDKRHARQHQCHGASLPTYDQGGTATNLQHDGDGQQHRGKRHPMLDHVLGRTIKPSDLADAGQDEIKPQQKSTGDAKH
jgi:hypothetical protein